MRVYSAYFLMKVVDTWFSKVPGLEPERLEVEYYLSTSLFTATDHDAAYDKASEMIPGLSDADHDGAGDLREFSCVGIYELAQVCALADLEVELASSYGLDTPALEFPKPDAIRAKRMEELELFRSYSR